MISFTQDKNVLQISLPFTFFSIRDSKLENKQIVENPPLKPCLLFSFRPSKTKKINNRKLNKIQENFVNSSPL